MLNGLKRRNYEGEVFLTALTEKDYDLLSDRVGDRLLKPHEMAATNFYNEYLKNQYSR